MPNKAEEEIIKSHVDKLVPKREHTHDCYTLLLLGETHDNCSCKCHKGSSPDPSSKAEIEKLRQEIEDLKKLINKSSRKKKN